MRKTAFTIIEVLVVIGIISLLIAIFLPVMEIARHKAYIGACGSNLRQIGQAISMYSNENHGYYPRTTYVAGAMPVAGTGTSKDPFVPDANPIPQPNDVTAPLWLLARVEKLPTKIFICPYNDVNEFEADPATPMSQSNFTKFDKNLGYSYANPYPDTAAFNAGYKLTSKLPGDFPVMGDLNPGVNSLRKSDVFAPQWNSPRSEIMESNSDNHEREGQNVLFADGHVTYCLTPFVGIANDNIYTPQTGNVLVTSPVTKDDTLLLPAD